MAKRGLLMICAAAAMLIGAAVASAAGITSSLFGGAVAEPSGGTAFISDVGMSGDYDSVIGMVKHEPVNRFIRRIPSSRFEPALGEATLCAVAVETDDASGLAQRIGAVRLGGRLEQAKPAFW